MTLPPDTPEFEPDWSVHPGAILQAILDERGIKQAELADRTSLTPKHINQIVKQNIGISGDVAQALEHALGLDALFWLRVDAAYQAHISREKAVSRLSEFVEWFESFDRPALVRHGIIGPKEAKESAVEKVLKFFGVATPTAFEQTWQRPRVSFRRSRAFEVVEQNTALWLRMLDLAGNAQEAAPFKVGALRALTKQLPAMTTLNVVDGFTVVRNALAEAGVRLVFVRQIAGSRMSAATWWLTADRPVIGITERQRKPDVLWFSLLHEIGHILLHPKRTTLLSLERERTEEDPAEQEADAFAENVLFPDDASDAIAKARTRDQLLMLATKLGVGPAIVAGRHGRLTGHWHIGSNLRPKITDAHVEALEELSGTRRLADLIPGKD
ncbi:addiction module HigA family antidote [Actinomadura pelletieri DSM 43383]|uniref:Addiction module HigA family antidote n=1 Tax=Actinomadura pelletieri DSM 43383 TaxID=1120940 RepID=A0A495QWX3_9ACTN|nr:ImmA/IrrE family metallo-endopeptidase [Actinomadura pelletieri]RKS78638.1 addiction module HigA family antidote [Actinomadura pelletieri DSM 43383]